MASEPSSRDIAVTGRRCMSPVAQGRLDGLHIEALETDHDHAAVAGLASLPGAVEMMRDAASDALNDETQGLAVDGCKALDPQHAIRLRRAFDPRNERFRSGDGIDRKSDAFEIVVVVILGRLMMGGAG